MSIQEMLKKTFMEQVKQFDIEELKRKENKTDTVTLYHGTNSVHLNSILENGILPHNLTGRHNWEDERAKPNENVVYLTNKWHYWYAYNSLEKLLRDKYGEDWSSVPEAQWWLTGNPMPLYIECKVPKVYLTLDEDIVYSKFIKDKVKAAMKKGEDLELNVNWEDCLAHQGTVGVRGGIRKEFIHSITFLGDPKLYLALMGEKTVYQKEFRKWIEGKGKGKMKNENLINVEQQYDFIGNIQVKSLPKGYKISQLYYDKSEKSIGFILNTPEEYLQQPNQLEKY